jgi:hypothetical protein
MARTDADFMRARCRAKAREAPGAPRQWVVRLFELPAGVAVKPNAWPIVAVPVPAESAVSRAYARTDLADAYSIRLPNGTSDDPALLARFILSNQAGWVAQLMRLRDALVARFGIKTSKELESARGERIRFFRVYDRSASEIILGEDDAHLDFRLSVMCRTETAADGPSAHLVMSTVVHCHNRLGRAYIMLIEPFHKMVVKSSLRRAAEVGWPAGVTR